MSRVNIPVESDRNDIVEVRFKRPDLVIVIYTDGKKSIHRMTWLQTVDAKGNIKSSSW